MKTGLKVGSFAAFLLLTLLLSVGECLAQENDSLPDLDKAKTVKSVVVATVNVGGAKLINQESNVFKIYFELSNRIGVQNEVRYAVELRDLKNELVIDRIVFDEALFLGEGQVIKKEIKYSAPEYLEGKYQIWIVSRNEKGMKLGSMRVGEAELKGDGKYVRIDREKCFLEISGDSKNYAPHQGVDISSGEEMVLRCQAENLFERELEVTPHFRTTFRSPFGETISEIQGEAVRFGSGEKKELKIAIPKAGAPQAYDVSIFLREDSGRTVSNPMFVHYVIRGTSGTINNITLDKDAYAENDTANISIFWAGRSDFFPGSRQPAGPEGVSLQVNISDPDGKKCAEEIKSNLGAQSGGGVEKVPALIIRDCSNGEVVVSLVDEKGNVLDSKSFKLKETKSATEAGRNSSIARYLAYALASVLLLVGLAAIFWKKRKAGGTIAMLVIFGFSGLLLNTKEAKADTIIVMVEATPVVFEAIINGTYSDGYYNFCQGDDMTVFGSGEWPGCFNVANAIAMVFWRDHPNEEPRCHPIGWRPGVVISEGFCSIETPSTTGTFNASVTAAVLKTTDYINYEEYYKSQHHLFPYRINDCSVPPDPQPGECDPNTIGKSYVLRSDVAAAGYCSVGQLRSSTFVETATGFSWQCDGVNGGSRSEVCTANRTPVSSEICFGVGVDPTCTMKSRNIQMGGMVSFPIRWNSTGANLCRVRTQKQTTIGGVTTWNDIASGDWTTTAGSEVRTPTGIEDSVTVYLSQIPQAGNYRYGLKCFNTEAGTSSPAGQAFDWLNVNYTASCTGTPCNVLKPNSVSCGATHENPLVDKNWVFNGNNCSGKCTCECRPDYCYDTSSGNCVPDRLGAPYCTPSPEVNCAGVCGSKTGETGLCVANNACGGVTNLPLSSCSTGCLAKVEDCNDCDNANWREVSP